MTSKILVICRLEDDLIMKYHSKLEYLPLSNDETDNTWETLLKQYQPQTIIFGLQNIDETKLSLWRQLQATAKLKLIRKGTSLHRVDFAAAKKYNIEILNTPGVNAPFVAEFIYNLLLNEKKKNNIAIIGVGDIGKKVVTKLLTEPVHLLLYNRSHYPFEGINYSYNNNLLKIFGEAQQVAICLPLSEKTKAIIKEHHIDALPQNAQVICISPPRIFSPNAIVALHERKGLHVIFDHVASGLTYIHKALGHSNLRKNFIFEEKAAASHECQYAMGEAAILNAQ